MAARNSACAAMCRRTMRKPANLRGDFSRFPAIHQSQPNRPLSQKPRQRGAANGGSWAAAPLCGMPSCTIRNSTSFSSVPANGTPWDRHARSPQGKDNLFTSSIVALKSDTGEYVWHYQEVPGAAWDYDAASPMILADLNINGAPRKVLMQAPKDGFFYVLDRATGKVISAKPYTPVNWATGIDAASGRPIENAAARYDATGKPAPLDR